MATPANQSIEPNMSVAPNMSTPNMSLANQTVASPADFAGGMSMEGNMTKMQPNMSTPQGVRYASPPVPKAPSAPTPSGTNVSSETGTVKVAGAGQQFSEGEQKIRDAVEASKRASEEMFAQQQAQSVGKAQQKTAPATAETTSKVNPDGSTTTETKDYTTPEAQQYKKQLDDSMASIDTEIQYAKSKFDGLMANADDAQANLIRSIEKTFEVRKYEMERTNKAALNTQQLLGSRSGRQRYAPEIQSSILSEEERAGLVRMTEIEALELQTIATAQSAAVEQDFMLLNGMMNTLQGLRGEKNDIMQNMYNLSVQEEQRAQTRAAFEVNLQTAIQQYEQTESTFRREEQEYQTSYLAQNLVQVAEDGSIQQVSDADIEQIATQMEVDPMILRAKVQQTARDLANYEVDMRASILQNRQLELANNLTDFNLYRGQTLLPYEIEQLEYESAAMALDNAKSEFELSGAIQALDSDTLTEKEQEALLKSQTFKDLKGNELLYNAIKNYQDKFLEFTNGGKGLDVLSKAEKAELSSLKAGITATLKDAKTLGTLDAGVQTLVDSLLGSLPEGEILPSVGLFIGAQNKMKSALEQIKAEADVKYNQLIDENPAYANSDSVLRTYRRSQGLPVSYSEWVNSETTTDAELQQFVNDIISAGGDPNSPEDSEEAWNAKFGFSKPLSMGVKGSNVAQIKDFTRATTSIGKGTVTGIDGSKFWKYGFDFVLDGGKGAPVRQPFSGTVVEAGEAGGFGKSVVVQLADGRKIRSSHLNDIRVKPGQKVNSRTILGGQGNTGRTYGKTGIHVDYTMYKPDGTPYSAREVASFFNTKALA